MRDRRFAAEHRGDPLAYNGHVLLARWAADCAERVLHLFGRCSDDVRPQQALDIARAWACGEVTFHADHQGRGVADARRSAKSS